MRRGRRRRLAALAALPPDGTGMACPLRSIVAGLPHDAVGEALGVGNGFF